MKRENVPSVIVGGGSVGLSLAILFEGVHARGLPDLDGSDHWAIGSTLSTFRATPAIGAGRVATGLMVCARTQVQLRYPR